MIEMGRVRILIVFIVFLIVGIFASVSHTLGDYCLHIEEELNKHREKELNKHTEKELNNAAW